MLDKLLFPLEWFVALVMVGFHDGLSKIGLSATSGLTWALAVVGLVVVLRIILIPLFVKQIKTSRRMQLIQPQMQAIQKKYKGKKDAESRQKMTEETMELYKRTGTNPFSSCMPILLQAPFFYALFRVLNNLGSIASSKKDPVGLMTRAAARQAEQSSLFGTRLSDSFLHTNGSGSAKIVALVLIVMMASTMFVTQHQLMRKNMPASALDNPMAKQQKIIMYVMPLFFFVTGPSFPIGVLLYWLTTNVWTMCQQFYVIRRMPSPGSAAEKALEERRRAKGKPMLGAAVSLDKAAAVAAADGPDEDDAKPKQSGQRVQPKRGQRNPAQRGPAQSGSFQGEGSRASSSTTSTMTTSGDTKIATAVDKNAAPPRGRTKRKR